MLKKFLVASSLLIATTGVALANTAPYIGAGLGITVNTVDDSNSVIKNSLFGNYRGVPFNLFAGFGGVVYQNFYLAGELDGTVGTAEISDNGGLKTSYSYGASIIPGLMLCDQTLLFARLGIEQTRFSTLSETATGGVFGLGMQTSLTQNIDIRGEYDFNAYRSVSTKLAGISYSANPRQDQFNVALVYKFD